MEEQHPPKQKNNFLFVKKEEQHPPKQNNYKNKNSKTNCVFLLFNMLLLNIYLDFCFKKHIKHILVVQVFAKYFIKKQIYLKKHILFIMLLLNIFQKKT